MIIFHFWPSFFRWDFYLSHTLGYGENTSGGLEITASLHKIMTLNFLCIKMLTERRQLFH
jgi:hypothetical protein